MYEHEPCGINVPSAEGTKKGGPDKKRGATGKEKTVLSRVLKLVAHPGPPNDAGDRHGDAQCFNQVSVGTHMASPYFFLNRNGFLLIR
jgi:hypothetical protein